MCVKLVPNYCLVHVNTTPIKMFMKSQAYKRENIDELTGELLDRQILLGWRGYNTLVLRIPMWPACGKNNIVCRIKVTIISLRKDLFHAIGRKINKNVSLKCVRVYRTQGFGDFHRQSNFYRYLMGVIRSRRSLIYEIDISFKVTDCCGQLTNGYNYGKFR